MEQEYVTLGQLEIEENVVGSSTISYSAPEPIPEHNVEGLRPTTEMPKQPTFDTSIGPISLNFDESSCLEPDQIPQNLGQLLRENLTRVSHQNLTRSILLQSRRSVS